MPPSRPAAARGTAFAVRHDETSALELHATAEGPPGRPAERMDAAGWSLFMFAILWIVASSVVRGGDPTPASASVWLAAIAMLAGRFGARIHAALVPAAVVGAGLIIVAVARGDAITGRATGGVLGYPNARAALFVVTLAAAMMVMTVAEPIAIRGASLAASGLFVAAIVSTGSLSGMIGAVGVVGVTAASTRIRPGRIAAMCAALAAAVLVGTVAIGFLYEPGRHGIIERSAEASISVRRAALWHEAIDIVVAHPVFGVGPRRFASESPTARSDSDARWAHNEFLQAASEMGFVGCALLIAIVGWAFVTLGRRPGAARVGPIAAGALAAFTAASCVDYLMHFPVVTAGVAMLAGAGVAPRDRS